MGMEGMGSMNRVRRWAANRMESIGGLSIQMKLIISFIVIILIPIVCLSWYLFHDIYLNRIQDMTKKNQYILDIEKTTIMNNMNLMERTAQLSLSNNEINDYLQSTEELDVKSLLDFKNKTFSTFQYFLFNNPSIANIRLFTDNPSIYELWPIIFKESRIANKSWYPTVIAQQGIVRWEINRSDQGALVTASPDPNRTELYISLLREFKKPDNTHNGVLEVNMELKNFFTKTFSMMQDRDSQMMIVSRDGSLYTNEQAEIFRRIPAAELARQFTMHHKGARDSFALTIEGQPFLFIQSYIDRLDITLVNAVSLQSTISDINKTRNQMILVTFVLIVLLSLISYFLHSLILKKLKILRDSMKKVRRGDFHVDIQVKGTDEVGELAHHFRQLLKQIQELIADAVNRQATAKEAELKALKNQIDSHFLYNTLENLKMMAEIEAQYTISDALTSLGSMMRYSLQWTSNHVKLSDEIGHIRHYIAIMNIRYEDRLELVLDIPKANLMQEVLKMSLQPIVENAVKYGLGSSQHQKPKLTITIRTMVIGDQMIIEIEDDGIGIDQRKRDEINRMLAADETEYQRMRAAAGSPDARSTGIGLRNVHHRISMFYGKEYGIRVKSQEGSYTQVRMVVPYFILAGGGVEQHAQAIDRR
ncbi:sensor histidine kinase [Paenibacillus guangzhouensis]|uniref:sensor histidine kinase n=1 Tax=Paenibacillus guangzhouensis TaxID=1473112 RepID=UPI001D108D0E|nr:histidine kinase [Paenibacillus guangzhouensis]